MQIGLALAQVNPSLWSDLAVAADELGFESVWLSDHLILPEVMSGSPMTGHESPPIPANTPTYDALGYLAFLAGRTQRVKLGTWVYSLALRHPFVAARAIQTVDIVSAGRLLIGVGAGWLKEEWDATEVDFTTRGARLDEALEICKRLWSEQTVEHSGEHFRFQPVMFEPKTPQNPHPPILIGGETPAALRRAVRQDGWMGLGHSPESATPIIERLRAERATTDRRDDPFDVTVGGQLTDPSEIDAWERAGVDRLIISPWRSTKDAIESSRVFAERFGLTS